MTTKKLLNLLNKYNNKLNKSQIIRNNILKNILLKNEKKSLLEIKQTFQKKKKQFQLENWFLSNNICVGRYLANKNDNYSMKYGSYSWGVWFKHTNYGTYRIHDSYGNLLAYRFDVLKDIQIIPSNDNENHDNNHDNNIHKQDIIQFFDLIVDLWVWPDENGNINPLETTLEDLEELSELQDKGIVNEDDSKIIEKTVSELLFDPLKYTKLVDDAIDQAIKYNS